MATYSRQKLVQRALQELGVLDANEAPEAEDSARGDEYAQALLEMLYEDGMIPFDLGDDIPATYFLPLVSKLTYRLVNVYGAIGRASKLAEDDVAADRRLNKLRQQAEVGSVTQATYF